MKNNTSPRSRGGQTTAKLLRQQAIDNYYARPNYCKYCGNIIIVRTGEKVKDVRVKKFCNRSCAAHYNNAQRPRPESTIKKPKKYYRPKGKMPLDEYLEKISISNLTKHELFSARKNWQSARSGIQKQARIIFFKHYGKCECFRNGCSYNLHLDVAHVTSVSDFDDDSTISEINNINNLIGLCKNCHWEFDHGHLTMSDISIPNSNNCNVN